MLSKRTICANLGDTNKRIRATKGCPQGGVMSPLLWCLVVDSLITRLNNAGFYTQGYADDLAIVIRGKVPMVLTDLMNESGGTD